VTKWRIHGSELQIETGLLRRQSIRLPLSRIQSVDLVRPLLARVFGLAEVRVQVAGSGRSRGRLTYLREHDAALLRARLLALAHGVSADTPPPPEEPLLTVPNQRVLLATLIGWPVIIFILLLAAAVVTAALAGPAAIFGWLAVVLPMGTVIWRKFNADFSFSIAQAPDGLRLSTGLLTTRHDTIPSGRVQAIRWIEPILWRPFHWCRLEIDVAQQRSRGRGGDNTDTGPVDRALLPVGSAEQARMLLARVFPEITPQDALQRPPSRRAKFKAPLSYRNLGVAQTEWYFVTASGRLRRELVIVPLAKVQSFRLVEGPVERKLGLVTVHADLVGKRWHSAARGRDVAEGRQLLEDLAAGARLARKRSPAERT
jgi:putative membrane protein